MDKNNIISELSNVSLENAKKDYIKLLNLDLENLNVRILTGNKFVNYFTYRERLETKGINGMNFFEFVERMDRFLNISSYRKIMNHLNETRPNLNTYSKYLKIFQLYQGSICIFKPVIAMKIYNQFKPKVVLDFTMGWGGRLVGACATNVEKYIGIDLNNNLRPLYDNMISELNNLGNKTQIELIFDDALNIDYSQMNYDMAFTSPPYYNKELYRGTNKKTKREWNQTFYEPLFRKTFDNLNLGGIYILNVSKNIYSNVCINLFGEANILIPLSTNQNSSKKKYEEFIYCWIKS